MEVTSAIPFKPHRNLYDRLSTIPDPTFTVIAPNGERGFGGRILLSDTEKLQINPSFQNVRNAFEEAKDKLQERGIPVGIYINDLVDALTQAVARVSPIAAEAIVVAKEIGEAYVLVSHSVSFFEKFAQHPPKAIVPGVELGLEVIPEIFNKPIVTAVATVVDAVLTEFKHHEGQGSPH